MRIRIVKMKERRRDNGRVILMLMVAGKWKSKKEGKNFRENVPINYKIKK